MLQTLLPRSKVLYVNGKVLPTITFSRMAQPVMEMELFPINTLFSASGFRMRTAWPELPLIPIPPFSRTELPWITPPAPPSIPTPPFATTLLPVRMHPSAHRMPSTPLLVE